MAPRNPQRGEEKVEIGGKSVRLVPSFQNLARIEEVAEAGLIEMARRMANGSVRLKDMVAVVTVASEPEISEEELAAAVEAEGMVILVEAATRFVLHALTGGKEGNGGAAERS